MTECTARLQDEIVSVVLVIDAADYIQDGSAQLNGGCLGEKIYNKIKNTVLGPEHPE